MSAQNPGGSIVPFGPVCQGYMSTDLNHTAQEYAERWQRAEERVRRLEADLAAARAWIIEDATNRGILPQVEEHILSHFGTGEALAAVREAQKFVRNSLGDKAREIETRLRAVFGE